MSDKKHAEILKKGSRALHEWMQINRHPHLDVSGENLHGVNLFGAYLSGANLTGANLGEAILIKGNLSRAVLRRAILGKTNLREADLSAADLSEADLRGADLADTDLNMANLSRATLRGANLRQAILRNADLSNADLSGADLSGANLSEADLSESLLGRVTLNGAIFKGAILYHTVFGDTDLSEVRGLDSVKHYSSSTIGLDSIYRSRGSISEKFLRGCGVSENFITFMRSLTGGAFEFYSCFISYSSKDQAFAERLHADLQSNSVRCWFAPEDMKIGDKMRPRIDDAIRFHDKLLLILSKSSINSAWVEKEVETAFEKEHQQNKLVLFPIRLDDTVMETDQAWAADIRRTRHIGEFSRWKDHDQYKVAFSRLIRDLKADLL